MKRNFCLDDSTLFHMIELDEVDSTNKFLRHLDTQGDNHMTLVTAEFQTAGRGTDQNHWESAKGENLLLSLRVMPSNLPIRRMFAISEVAALGIRDALGAFLPPASCSLPLFSIKWPNDIYYGDSKVAGVLIENDLQGDRVLRSTIGIGININQHRFLSDAPNPRSLADIVGHNVERRFVLEQFMNCFTHYMQQIDDGKPDALDALHDSYIKHLYRCGEEHSYSDKDGAFRATLTNVEPTGHLILRDSCGLLRRYAFKEVKFELNEE
jgi:BirA family biotin operon repressor/biotin-[acetyl-CoA-carboxylase] ligase